MSTSSDSHFHRVSISVFMIDLRSVALVSTHRLNFDETNLSAFHKCSTVDAIKHSFEEMPLSGH